MKKIAIIPARMGSSRFPNKPLAKILGYPMIEHVYKRARLNRELDDVVVATCDQEIVKAVEAFGGKAVMTADSHERGTDRIAEAAQKMNLENSDIVINVQGDEPMLAPDMITFALSGYKKNQKWKTVNLIGKIKDENELKDLNTIKVVCNTYDEAIYMSRQAIPSLYGNKKISPDSHWKQICIIPFTVEVLNQFTKLKQTSLEKHESIDMMRLIENAIPVGTVKYDGPDSYAVDTEADLKKVENLLKNDPIFLKIFQGAR